MLLPAGGPTGRRMSPIMVGFGILCLGLPALWAAWLVSVLFERWPPLGWVGLLVTLAGFGFLCVGVARELRGLAVLRKVDQLRVELASGEATKVADAARRWLATLPQYAGVLPALHASDSPETALALLRAGPALALREEADALGRTAAFQTVAIVAATPSPALEVFTVGWRGLRLVRQVASLHGMRPGLLGTVVLLQKTALAAVAVAATEVAVNAATHAIITHPLLRHVVGDIAGAGVAARRMIVLARATAAACSPLSPG